MTFPTISISIMDGKNGLLVDGHLYLLTALMRTFQEAVEPQNNWNGLHTNQDNQPGPDKTTSEAERWQTQTAK